MISREVKRWLIKALNDYKTAAQLLHALPEEMITDTLCFHCEQFVEKALKSFLVKHNIDFDRTHDLRYLTKLCSDLDIDFEWLYEVARKLSEYAVEVRYPDDFYVPSVKEARECFEIVTKVKNFVFEKFGIGEEEIVYHV